LKPAVLALAMLFAVMSSCRCKDDARDMLIWLVSVISGLKVSAENVATLAGTVK
jgi:hypothetical protein